MMTKKNRRPQKGEKKKPVKKMGGKEIPTDFRRKASMVELVRKWIAFASQKKSLVFTYILKDFQPVLLGEIKKEEKAGQGEN